MDVGYGPTPVAVCCPMFWKKNVLWRIAVELANGSHKSSTEVYTIVNGRKFENYDFFTYMYMYAFYIF